MRKFIVALFLVMVVSAVVVHFQPVHFKAKETVPVVHACTDECTGDSECSGGLSCCAPDANHPCTYCAEKCGSVSPPSGEDIDQCQVNQDCVNKGLGNYCCKVGDHNECWDCPCNDPNCNGGGGGSGGGNGCDVTPPTGLSANPSYASASITWSHGHNDHQELFVDPDPSKVENDCANGCFLKKTDLAYSANAYTVTGLQQGTTYYYKIVSVKDCDSKAAEPLPAMSPPQQAFTHPLPTTTPSSPGSRATTPIRNSTLTRTRTEWTVTPRVTQRRREKTTDYTD